MLESKRNPLKLEDAGRAYLDEIFDHIWHIHNPTPLNIAGLKRITATSMVLQRGHEGRVESYFTFKQGEDSGEIVRRENRYYILGKPIQANS